MILADDLGFSDIGAYGGEIATPHLDGLAREGLRFSQFYNAARCCPTRASLLTGVYPHQAGMGNMALFSPRLKDPAYQGVLSDSTLTIAEALREAGYRTLMSGKWHVGYPAAARPNARGFEHAFFANDGAPGYWKSKLFLDARPAKQTRYLTDEFTDEAVRFVKEYAGKPQPFFLYLAYTAPHYPLHAPEADIAKYRGRYLGGWDALREERYRRLQASGLIRSGASLAPPEAPAWSEVADKPGEDLKMAVYAAQVSHMDDGIGALLAALKERGVERNTVVVFLSDNGASNEDPEPGRRSAGGPLGTQESYASYGTPWAHLSNTPFRSYKKWAYEGGIATPLIVRWPEGVKRPGTITDQVGHVVDIMATCLELAGARYPEAYAGRRLVPLQGLSLVPVLEDRVREGHKRLFWEHNGSGAVREGRFKLVRGTLKAPWELYDLEADRTETRDLAAAEPARVAELLEAFTAWAAEVGVKPLGNVAPSGGRKPPRNPKPAPGR